MSTPAEDWSGLGFDPAPGDPAAVEQLSKTLAQAAQHLQGVHDTITRLGQPGGTWTGDAQQAFSGQLGQLPDRLKHAGDSVDTARQELDKWWKELDANRPRANDYEQQAKTLRASLKDAQAEHAQAGANSDLGLVDQTFPDDAGRAAAQQRYNTAKATLDAAATRLGSAQDALNRVLGQASQLYSDQQGFGLDRANAIRGAADHEAPHKPGLWDWIENHGADFLTVAASVAGIVALFCPAVALVALVLSAAALVAHVSTYIGQQGLSAFFPPSSKNMGNWLTVGGDALGVIPGVSEIKAGATAARAADGFGASVKAGVSATQAGMKALDASNPVASAMQKPLAKWLGEKGLQNSETVATNVTRAGQGAVMAGLTTPTALSLGNNSDNDWVNGTTAGGNAVNSLGFVHGEGSGTRGTVLGTLAMVGGAFGFGWSLQGNN
ncbi:WXG100 family type VII secretion target [Kitasatospora sp. NBC_01287]|uniref:hypothetical protein n=1 Tax=Kitasatospora sp. NBC_01287 TaxID=2903573 RepID=UPI0022521818|nr:hypothetical protein [Kitasatospora sp. NBC_01287]MCX4751511.1 WXG100 family type VII secretion target [Kitasatospora sp. NBC_01287]